MKLYMGIDIGKRQLDVFYQEKHRCFDNTNSGIKKLIEYLEDESGFNISDDLIVFEATGGYENYLQSCLQEKSYRYHMAHPNKIRALAKAKGLLVKTDKVDAKLIAYYGELMRPEADSVKANQEVKALPKRREQLISERIREESLLDKKHGTFVKESINKHVDWLKLEIKAIEKKLKNREDCKNYLQSLHIPTAGCSSMKHFVLRACV